MASHIEQIGLIAGNGRFPILFARAARDQQVKVVAAAIRGDTSLLLRPFVERMAWFRVGELEKLFDYFRRHRVRHVLMAGQVNPGNLFDERVLAAMDPTFRNLFAALKDHRADTIFSAVADLLNKQDMELLDSTFLLKKYLAPHGTLTRRGPSETELADIRFGRDIAKSMGGLDVGQTVVIKEKAIVAIEAMEGTDRCIARGSRIARRGAVVVKMSKPRQDQRFDIPVIGPRTLRTMAAGRAGCLAVEAGKTLIIDRPVCVRLADKAGICVVAC